MKKSKLKPIVHPTIKEFLMKEAKGLYKTFTPAQKKLTPLATVFKIIRTAWKEGEKLDYEQRKESK